MYTRHAVLPTLDGCTENWYKVVSIEILACLTQEKKIKSFCLFFRSSYSSLSIEMHQLHQLQCQFIFFKTCSDKESSDGFIKVHQKKTKVIDEKLFKSYQVYQAVFQERVDLFQYCGSICVVPRRHPGNSKFSISPTQGCSPGTSEPVAAFFEKQF